MSRRQCFILFVIQLLTFCCMIYVLENGLGAHHFGRIQQSRDHEEDERMQISLSRDHQPHEKRRPNETTYLAMVIVSNAKSAEKRQTIRKTWMKLTKEPSFYRFAVSAGQLGSSDKQSLEAENRTFNDLLIFDQLIEEYNHLTLKVLRSFVWFAENVQFRFLLKLDDDSFVQHDKLVQALREIDTKATGFENRDLLYWGFFDGRAPVRKKGKWTESDWVLCDRYLPHALGGGYVLSRSLVKFIADNAPVLQIYKNEDVAVGAWLSGLKIRYVHDTRFDTEWKSRGCFNRYLITHKQSDREMYRKYDQLIKTGTMCPSEKRIRPSYEYNWAVPPSRCCKRTNSTASNDAGDTNLI